jgi:hypothetical protein
MKKKEALHMKNGKVLSFEAYQKAVDKAYSKFIKGYNPNIKTKEIGRFAVDSGKCYIGDPYYLTDPSHIVETDDNIKGWGVLAENFGGDGGYSVYGEYDGKQLVRLIVDFTNSDNYPKNEIINKRKRK